MQAEFYLKAQDKNVGIFRYYFISIVPTLFKDWALLITHGRIGQKARQRIVFISDTTELAKRFKQILLKRLKAEKRLGCSYKIVDHSYDKEFKELVFEKLPLFIFK